MRRTILALSIFTLIQAASGAGSSGQALPNDQFFSQQWALNNIGGVNQIVMVDADDMHTIMQQGVAGADIGWLDARDEVSKLATNPVLVAVADSGLDITHPDLAGRWIPGKDFLTNFIIMSDPFGHGTHVSGIIAANADNGIGIAGITPAPVKILPLRMIWAGNDPNGNGFSYRDPDLSVQAGHNVFSLISDFAAKAVNYAASRGVRIMNYSGTWPKIADTPNAQNSFKNAIFPSPTPSGSAGNGILVVAAAGNDHKDQPTYPCSYEGVLCVGAITNTGQLANFSNFGGLVDVLAPGDGILSTYSTQVESQALRINGYELLSGTSQSAPQVTGVAAAVMSAFPNISLNELKARLFVSAGPLPSKDAALYGVVNLKRALDAQPQPVYYPDFKSIGELPIDESSLTVKGQISVQNLWLASMGVSVQVTANGKAAGTGQADTLASGASVSIPWSYQFGSIDDSSMIRLAVHVTDAAGTVKDFAVNVSAVRPVQAIQANMTQTVPGVTSTIPSCTGQLSTVDWICQNNGHLFPTPAGPGVTPLTAVESYPAEPGLPRYFKQIGSNGNFSATVQIYDPSNTASPLTLLTIPGIAGVNEVIRLDALGDGRMDWVFIGVGENTGEPVPHWEFFYTDPQFKPLFGTPQASNFGAYVTYNAKTHASSIGSLKLSRSYGGAGSWIRVNGMLFPAILDAGGLPDKDNFGETDARHYASAEHLYYLAPISTPAPTAGVADPAAKTGSWLSRLFGKKTVSNPVPAPSASPAPAAQMVSLEVRALDNSTFRTQYPQIHLENVIPEGAADMKAGRIRILAANGSDLLAPTMIWDVQSVTNASLTAAPGWDQISANSNSYAVMTPNSSTNSSAFVDLFSTETASIAWADPSGQFLDNSEFSFTKSQNPISGFIGAFNLPTLGRFWFLQSGFDLVGYRQSSATGNAGIEMQTIQLERDSSFQLNFFNQMFTPVLVGTPANPLPGVYYDSTLVRGNQVSVSVWNSANDDIERPLRYSLQIPDGCLEMNPVQLTSDAESFGLPLFCVQSGGQMQFVAVKPQ